MKNNILNNIIVGVNKSDIKIVLPEYADTRVKEAESRIKQIGIEPIFPNSDIYNLDKYVSYISNLKFTDFNKLKGIQSKWKKIYTLMLRILMKLVLCSNLQIQLKSMNLKIRTI